jgi:Rad3-related DNA helicase
MGPVFAPDGPVAQLLGDVYRPRDGQMLMARLVERALVDKRHALIEAGTGSGKSFAYLIPLIWTGQRAFISTANKTLQNQLWEKDLPALQRIAPRTFRVALLKGRSNYVCRVKLEQARQQLALLTGGFSAEDLVDRLEDTPSGDVEALRLFGKLRDRVTVGRNECLGRQCPHAGRCYYEMARLEAEKADIVVLNHALLAFNLKLEGQIVEPRKALVIDEAHDFVPYVVGALRLRLASDHVPAFLNDAFVSEKADQALRRRAMHANQELFTYLTPERGGRGYRWAAPKDLPAARRLADHVKRIHGQLTKRYSPAAGRGGEREEDARHQMVIDWAAELVGDLSALGRPVADAEVRYCEQGAGRGDGPGVILCQEPVDVSGFLRETLWDEAETVVCTSATLTVGGRFDHFGRQSGALHASSIESVIPGPFDYGRQALLYTPDGLHPAYGDGEGEYVEKLAAEVERLIQAARGRTFVLCTSTRRVRELFALLAPRLPFTCYRQGMRAREELLNAFRADEEGAVLFATRSFWQGVDVPGEALSLVIIDKLPFAPYKDPVIEHRQERIRAAGADPFQVYLLPEAILALKQGVGRLIRTETDRGVIAILDSRVNTKGYGRQVIASLPPARRTRRFEDVVGFFGGEAPL